MQDPERWALIKELFDQLVSRAPDEQEHALLALDGDASGVRGEVARLLAFARSGSRTAIDGRAIDLLTGARDPIPDVFGRFAITRRLGSGGMGVVYEAFDPLRATRVALKVLTRATPASVALFKNEFRSLANVHHPNLVTLYDLFEQGGRWFFTMEFVEGGRLFEHLDAAADRWTAVRATMAGLADGLAALHRARKLHRDVKPSNIMVAPDGRVVLLDFGLVADLEPGGERDPIFAGTPKYMSPEQIRREPLTAASDVYSVGVVLSEALGSDSPERFGAIPPDLACLRERLLHPSPERRPSALEVLNDLRPRSGPGVPACIGALVPDPDRLVGRVHERRVLASALADAGGGPLVVAVEGHSGIGKTALVDAFLTDTQRQAVALTLSARCYERESISFNVFDSLSDGLNAHLRTFDSETLSGLLPPDVGVLGLMFPKLKWLHRAPPVSTSLDRQQLRRAGGRVLRELLRNLGTALPLVLFVDDVQWADVDSAEMLLELLRDSDGLPMLLILGFRSEDRAHSPALALLFAELGSGDVTFRRLELDSLSPESAVAMASALLAAPGEHPCDREHAERIARESAGNPFFIGELAAYARRGRQGGDLEPSLAGLTLTSVILTRARQLPPAAQRLLDTVAIAGRPIRSTDALTAALGDERSLTWLALLRTDRFIRVLTTDAGELVEPFHDRIRETVVAALEAVARRERHHALARTLEGAGSADPELLAIHFEGAGQPELAGRYFEAAAEEASAALAFNSAVQRYDKALALRALTEARRLDLVRARAHALANAGRTFEAAQSFLEAADGSLDGQTSLSRAGYYFAASGRLQHAKQAFARVNANLGITVPLAGRSTLARLLGLRSWLGFRRYRFQERPSESIPPLELARIDVCWFVGAGLGLVELMTGALFTTYALHLALRSGDARRIARGLTWEAATAASQSPAGKKQARVLFQVCRELVERLQDPYCLAMLSMCEGLEDFSHGRWASARQRLDAAELLFTRDCIGVSYELATLNGFKLQTCVYAGRYRELREITPPILDAAQSTNDLYIETFIRGAILPLLHLADDRPDRARASIDAALSAWTSPGYHLQHALIDQVRMGVELYEGFPSEAVAIVDERWPLLKRSGLLYNQNLRAKLLELRAKALIAVRLSAPRLAVARQASACVRQLEREREDYFQGSVLSLQALLARADGHGRVADRLMACAVSAYDRVSMHDYSAGSAYRLAEWQLDDDARSRASGRLRAEGIHNPERWARMRAPSSTIRGSIR